MAMRIHEPAQITHIVGEHAAGQLFVHHADRAIGLYIALICPVVKRADVIDQVLFQNGAGIVSCEHRGW